MSMNESNDRITAMKANGEPLIEYGEDCIYCMICIPNKPLKAASAHMRIVHGITTPSNWQTQQRLAFYGLKAGQRLVCRHIRNKMSQSQKEILDDERFDRLMEMSDKNLYKTNAIGIKKLIIPVSDETRTRCSAHAKRQFPSKGEHLPNTKLESNCIICNGLITREIKHYPNAIKEHDRHRLAPKRKTCSLDCTRKHLSIMAKKRYANRPVSSKGQFA